MLPVQELEQIKDVRMFSLDLINFYDQIFYFCMIKIVLSCSLKLFHGFPHKLIVQQLLALKERIFDYSFNLFF